MAESTGWQHGVEIDLTPIGAHMLLGVPMDSLANRVVELEHVLGWFAARLAEQLYETESWPARFDLLDAAIASRLAAAREPAPAISWAWRRLNETGGRLGIGALADELGSSRQYLVTKFREAVGLPPKTLARILRFQRAIQLLERADHARLTRIARECGYFAHAEMHLGAGTIMPKSPMAEAEYRMMSPRALRGISQCLYVTVDDPDAHYEHAKAAGAEIVMEPFDTEYGARNYTTWDLEGHLWSFGTYSPRGSSAQAEV